jgi:hypothetical protein
MPHNCRHPAEIPFKSPKSDSFVTQVHLISGLAPIILDWKPERYRRVHCIAFCKSAQDKIHFTQVPNPRINNNKRIHDAGPDSKIFLCGSRPVSVSRWKLIWHRWFSVSGSSMSKGGHSSNVRSGFPSVADFNLSPRADNSLAVPMIISPFSRPVYWKIRIFDGAL